MWLDGPTEDPMETDRGGEDGEGSKQSTAADVPTDFPRTSDLASAINKIQNKEGLLKRDYSQLDADDRAWNDAMMKKQKATDWDAQDEDSNEYAEYIDFHDKLHVLDPHAVIEKTGRRGRQEPSIGWDKFLDPKAKARVFLHHTEDNSMKLGFWANDLRGEGTKSYSIFSITDGAKAKPGLSFITMVGKDFEQSFSTNRDIGAMSRNHELVLRIPAGRVIVDKVPTMAQAAFNGFALEYSHPNEVYAEYLHEQGGKFDGTIKAGKVYPQALLDNLDINTELEKASEATKQGSDSTQSKSTTASVIQEKPNVVSMILGDDTAHSKKSTAGKPGQANKDKEPLQPMAHIHRLRFSCTGAVFEGLAAFRDIYTDKTQHAPETVRNAKFVASLALTLHRGNRWPLTLFIKYPDEAFKSKIIQDFRERAIDPLVEAVTSGWSYYHPYVDLYSNNLEDKLPAVEGLPFVYKKGGDGIGQVIPFPEQNRFNTIVDYEVATTVGIAREIQNLDERMANLAATDSYAWYVEVKHQKGFVPEGHRGEDASADPDAMEVEEEDLDDENVKFRLYTVYVQVAPEVRNKFKGAGVEASQEYLIRHQDRSSFVAGERHHPIGTVYADRQQDDTCKAHKMDFVMAVQVPTYSKIVITSGADIQEARRLKPNGHVVKLEHKTNEVPLQRFLNAFDNLKKPARRDLANVLVGAIASNYPFDPKIVESGPTIRYNQAHGRRFPRLAEFARNGKKLVRSAADVKEYDAWVKQLDSCNHLLGWKLNSSQRDAVLLPANQSLINLVQGPPGTGKTLTVTAAVHLSVYAGYNVLVVAPSNGPIDEIAQRLDDMRKHDPALRYTVLREHVPYAEAQFSKLKQKDAASYKPKSKDDMREALAQIQEKDSSTINDEEAFANAQYLLRDARGSHFVKSVLSSTQCVFDCAESLYKARDKYDVCTFTEKEQTLMTAARDIVESRPKLHIVGPEQVTATDAFNKAMRTLRREVLSKKARVVLTTCANSANRDLAKFFKPDIVIIDEAAQGTEPDMLVPMLTFPTAKSYIFFGDPRQLKPTVLNTINSEFHNQLALSLFARLEALGIDIHSLMYQYRMTKELCAVPNQIFYSGKIRSDFGVPPNHNKILAFKHFLGRSVWNLASPKIPEKFDTLRESVFIDLPDSQGFKEVGVYSLTNFTEAKCTAT